MITQTDSKAKNPKSLARAYVDDKPESTVRGCKGCMRIGHVSGC